MFAPIPGLIRYVTAMPIVTDTKVIAKKMLTALIASIPALPASLTDKKDDVIKANINGVIIILIRLINITPSILNPSGFIKEPRAGINLAEHPKTIPKAKAKATLWESFKPK